MKKLIKPIKTNLAEIFQSIDTKFAFVTKNKQTYTQIHTPAKCRDFLGDCIWSNKTKKPVSIYNFTYNFAETPYDEKKLRLSITFPSNDIKTNFTNNFHKLHEKETQAKVSNSKYYPTDDKQTIILEASKIWQSSAWKISLFTFYLKLLCYQDITKLSHPESQYSLELTKPKEDRLLSKLRTKKDYVPDEIHMQHNYTGFVALLKNKNPILSKYLFKGL